MLDTTKLDKDAFSDDFKQSLHEEFEHSVEKEVQARLARKTAQLDDASNEYKAVLDENFSEAVEDFKDELNDKIERYLDHVVEEFVSEQADNLESLLESTKGDALLSIFAKASNVLGKDLATAINENHDFDYNNEQARLIESYKSKISQLQQQNKSLQQREYANRLDLILERRTKGFSMYETQEVSDMVHDALRDIPNAVALSESALTRIVERCKNEVSKANTPRSRFNGVNQNNTIINESQPVKDNSEDWRRFV